MMSDEHTVIQAVLAEVEKAVVGKTDILEKIMMAILAGGHILIDDVPGVGKTTISIAFAKALGVSHKRMQFTPDVLPSDITGFSMYDKNTNTFRYIAGTGMTNILLADEINRTSPRTQSALLEVMEEGNITVDGITRPVPKPFTVIATQNPAGSIGTQALPESQVDRFLIRLSIGYPGVAEEIQILKEIHDHALHTIKSIVNAEIIIQLQEATKRVYVDDSIYEYIAELAAATRRSPLILFGISPRGSVAAIKMIQARAMLDGRSFARPDDVTAILKPVLQHRLIITSQARFKHRSVDDIFAEIVQSIPLPKIVE
ncbi:MoxR family ATPase [Megasphaera paucivorans]|uniref:MoxR-like ATPase n=1 Tax=Megasphaera paucivorans TaxID=349095 RepID=A0A1G9YMV4_9FIRM|nr:MoxR family ATPase [Megasphaera paucivorans]SDN10488.1 MoxR-like ATPase [Megasphaera paucivorans]